MGGTWYLQASTQRHLVNHTITEATPYVRVYMYSTLLYQVMVHYYGTYEYNDRTQYGTGTSFTYPNRYE